MYPSGEREMSICVLCEKPSQARDIANVLGARQREEGFIEGNGYVVTWCLGHLLELAPPESYQANIKPWRLEALPVMPTQWQLLPNKQTTKQLTAIKKILKKIQHVIIATDADREGDVIGREVLDYVNYNGTIERLWLGALDDESIRKAFKELKPDSFSRDLYYSGLARQRADWLIGMNMTMATTSQFSKGSGVLSVGRVQSPTLKLIVDRDNDIENFKPKDFFDLTITVIKEEKSFQAKWVVPEELADEEGRCLRYGDADVALINVKGNLLQVIKYEENKKEQKTPLGLSLSTLQKLCSSKFGFTAKETLQIAQALYETHKATTYPRTDCQYLPLSQLSDSEAIFKILSQQSDDYLKLVEASDLSIKSKIWNDKKITAHHAIIPTLNNKVSIESMSDKEKKVYDLVCRYYLAQFLGNYEYFHKEVELSHVKDIFKASSHTPVYLGWKLALQPTKEETEGEPESVQDIPFLKIHDELKCIDAEVETKKTKPPARFTEGSLITAMKNIAKYLEDDKAKKILKESAGIGTEATRANIIETLLNRNYIERNKKQLISTLRGRELVTLLPDVVVDPMLTANWEAKLDEIAQGQESLDDFMNAQSNLLGKMLEAIQYHKTTSLSSDDSGYHCPACKNSLIRRKGKFGYFWGCSDYPTCKENYKDIKGKPFLDKKKYSCPECQEGYLQSRSGKKGKFWGCSNYPNCKKIVNDTRGKPEGFTAE